jgi:hypothetical protein
MTAGTKSYPRGGKSTNSSMITNHNLIEIYSLDREVSGIM